MFVDIVVSSLPIMCRSLSILRPTLMSPTTRTCNYVHYYWWRVA